jgi:hypothetical protein
MPEIVQQLKCLRGHLRTEENVYKRGCKECQRQRVHKQRLKYPEKFRESCRKSARKVKDNDPRIPMLNSARKRAKNNSLPFSISLEDIVIPKVCPILGIDLVIGAGRASICSPTLDRVIQELGYTKGNVQVISWRANRIKNDATIEELLKVVKYMKGNNA